MSNRKMSEVQVHHEGDEDHLVKELKVVNFDQANRLEVREFVFASFQTTGPNRYAEVKSKFGPLAATDDDPSGKIQIPSRFSRKKPAFSTRRSKRLLRTSPSKLRKTQGLWDMKMAIKRDLQRLIGKFKSRLRPELNNSTISSKRWKTHGSIFLGLMNESLLR